MSQPSSQGSTGTQEIFSQGSFEEIWQTLKRTFSNPETVVQGVLTEPIPVTIEYQDEPEQDNIQVTYQKRTFRNASLQGLQQGSDIDVEHLDQRSPTTETRNQNGHNFLVNGSVCPSVRSGQVDIVHLPPILPNTNYPGDYRFSISFEPNTGPITKATPWVYQQEHHKLFVKMQCVCPILFKIHGNPPPGSVVRGILTYKRPEHYKDIVIRCPNHRNTCKDGHPYQDHVMRCENSATRYDICPSTGRLSLVIPLKATNVVVGEGYFKELFKFTCFNSCVGGMNRRPTNLLFRLEYGGEVYGRALVEVRICASPGRDCSEKDSSTIQKNVKDSEKRGNEPSSVTDHVPTTAPLSSSVPYCVGSTSPTYPLRASVICTSGKDVSCSVQPAFHFPAIQMTQKKRPCPTTAYEVARDGVRLKQAKRAGLSEPADDEIFTLLIRGRERYEMLLKIKEGLDLLDGIKPSDNSVQQRYVQNELKRSPTEFTKIKPKTEHVHVKREEVKNSQCNSQQDASPQSSQESPDLSQLSQLSRTSSNASQSSTISQTAEEFSAWQVTLKRTLTLDKSSRSRTCSQ